MEDKEKKKELVPQEFEKLPAEVRADMLSSEKSIFFNVALFEQANRIAVMFAKSTMVPDHFKDNVGNCMIALNYAMRLQADPFMVMQCLYVVHGRPGVEGKLVEAIINQSGKYLEPLEYEWLDPKDNPVSRQEVLKADIPSEYGCQASAIDRKSNKRVTGPKITWALIKAKGWYDRKGPDGTIESNNWRAMPEMMFVYRSASWFSNKNCPELKLGMYTVEELDEVVDLKPRQNGSYGIPNAASDLNDKLKGKPGTQAETKTDLYKAKESEKEEKKEKKTRGSRKKKEEPESTKEKPKDATPNSVNSYGEGMQSESDETKGDPGSETPTEKILRLVTGAEMDDNLKQPSIPCPQRENTKIPSNWCLQSCKDRGECKPWADYNPV
jgi:hypothetical protein